MIDMTMIEYDTYDAMIDTLEQGIDHLTEVQAERLRRIAWSAFDRLPPGSEWEARLLPHGE